MCFFRLQPLSTFQRQTPFFTELISRLGHEIVDTAYTALGPGVQAAIDATKTDEYRQKSDFHKMVFLVELFNDLLNRPETPESAQVKKTICDR